MESTIQGNNIPDDILASEIFSRIPAKTLIRFTAVCKSWSSLIINPNFIAAHLNRMKLSRHLNHMNLSGLINKGYYSYTILSEGEEEPPPCGDEDERSKFMFPLGFKCEHIIGRSCDGLFCLIMRYLGGRGIFLWNPSIRKFKTLQTFCYDDISRRSRKIFYVFGFGYDEPNKDHKVVKITLASITKIDIHRLSTSSWHEVQEARVPKSLREIYRTGISLNGAIHWLTKQKFYGLVDLKSIVSFHFDEETFKEMILPSEMQIDVDLFVGMNEFKGSIAILHANTFWADQHCLWVMNKYGFTESWTKTMISIPTEFCRWPLHFTKDGTIVLKKKDHFMLYGLEDHKIKYIFGNLRFPEKIFDFSESLLLADYEDDWLMHKTRGVYCGRRLRYTEPYHLE